jgi:alkaline phosphatase
MQMNTTTLATARTALALAIGLALVTPASLAAGKGNLDQTTGWMRNHPAKHIIMLVGDGMQLEHEVATSRYLYGRDYALSFHQLPHETNVTTWDVTTYNKYAAAAGAPGYKAYNLAANDPIIGYDPAKGGQLPSPLQATPDESYFRLPAAYATDSASAATAWATGEKTDDGNIAWRTGDPPNGRLTTIAETLRKEKGYAIGVVSTVPFSHATPAAYVSHNVSRNNYQQIAAEILETVKPEVVIGGGHPRWTGKYNYLSEATYNKVKADPGYQVVERVASQDGGAALRLAAQQAAAQGKKLFGLFGGAGGNFESPEPSDSPGNPSINRYEENPLLADAVVATLDVLSKDPDGFFVMAEQGDIDWANHANDFSRMVGTTWDLDNAVRAVIDYVNRPGDDLHWDNTLLIVTSDHGNSYMRLSPEKPLGKGDLPTQAGTCGYGGPACTYPTGEVSYKTTGHTNELVRLYGKGRGAELFRRYEGMLYPGAPIIDNTQIYHVMLKAAGL